MVNLYIADKYSKNKNKVPISKFCVNCEHMDNKTEYFLNLQKENLKKLQNKKPKFKNNAEICSKCKSLRIKIRKNKERLHFEKDKGILQCHAQNPFLDCLCLKCNNTWTSSLPMPQKPYYKLSPKVTKEQIQLALHHGYKFKKPTKFS